MESSVSKTIMLRATASMHADWEDVGVSAISRRWDLAASVRSLNIYIENNTENT